MARSKEFEEEEVLKKALDIFWDKGYHATSAQTLVDGLSISRSSLYDTFTDKRQLFIRALQKYRQQASGKMIRMLEESTNPEATIREMFAYVLGESIDYQSGKGCFMVNVGIEIAPHDQEIAQIVNQNNEQVLAALTRLIEKGQAQGQFDERQPAEALARFIFNTISGIRVAERSGSNLKSLQSVVDVALFALKKHS